MASPGQPGNQRTETFTSSPGNPRNRWRASPEPGSGGHLCARAWYRRVARHDRRSGCHRPGVGYPSSQAPCRPGGPGPPAAAAVTRSHVPRPASPRPERPIPELSGATAVTSICHEHASSATWGCSSRVAGPDPLPGLLGSLTPPPPPRLLAPAATTASQPQPRGPDACLRTGRWTSKVRIHGPAGRARLR